MTRFALLGLLLATVPSPAGAQVLIYSPMSATEPCVDIQSPCGRTCPPGTAEATFVFGGATRCACLPGPDSTEPPVFCCSLAMPGSTCPLGDPALGCVTVDGPGPDVCLPPETCLAGGAGRVEVDECLTTPGGVRTPYYALGDCDGDSVPNGRDTDPRNPCCNEDIDTACCLAADLSRTTCCALDVDPVRCCLADGGDGPECCGTDLRCCFDHGSPSDCCMGTGMDAVSCCASHPNPRSCCEAAGGARTDCCTYDARPFACCMSAGGTQEQCCAAYPGDPSCPDAGTDVGPNDGGAADTGAADAGPDAGASDGGSRFDGGVGSDAPTGNLGFGGGGGCRCAAPRPRAPLPIAACAVVVAVAVPMFRRRR